MEQSSEYEGPRLLREDELSASERLFRVSFGIYADEAVDQPPEPRQRRRSREQGEVQVITYHGELVSQIAIFHTPLHVYDSLVYIGSVGGVGTHPDHRGQGLASRLLDRCAQRLVEGGASLMLISGGRGLYTRTGNVISGRYAQFVLRPGERPAPEGIRLRPLCAEDAAICSRFYHSERVHFRRRVEKFSGYLRGGSGGFHAEDWLVEMDGQPAGYLLLNTPWEYVDQPDAGVRHIFEYAGSRVALAGALRAAVEKQGLRELWAPVPWQDIDFIQLLTMECGKPSWMELPDHTMRILNFPRLMTSLGPYVRARLDPKLRRGLRFEQSGPLLENMPGQKEQARYILRRGKDRLELDGRQATRLVMGDPQDLLEIDPPGALADVFAALFPLPSFLVGMDYH